MSAKVSVIIPTVGRSTLMRAMRSVALQAHRGDEIIVMGDGAQLGARAMSLSVAALFPHINVHCFYDQHTGRWGHRQRQTGMHIADGHYIAFLDDDDIWGPHARYYIDYHIGCYPGQPLMFRMITPDGRLLWNDPAIREGNVGTPMIVVPNIQDRLGRWGNRYEGDYDFISSLKWEPAEFVWSTGIICICRPPPGHCWVDADEPLTTGQ